MPDGVSLVVDKTQTSTTNVTKKYIDLINKNRVFSPIDCTSLTFDNENELIFVGLLEGDRHEFFSLLGTGQWFEFRIKNQLWPYFRGQIKEVAGPTVTFTLLYQDSDGNAIDETDDIQLKLTALADSDDNDQILCRIDRLPRDGSWIPEFVTSGIREFRTS